ncbi:MAG TPA: YcnI family protein [Gaiellaceae bacterium]
MKLRHTLVAAVAVGLVVAPAAATHVTVNPDRVLGGSLNRFEILVPNEKEVPTVKVTVQLPNGLEKVTFQPKAGWKRSVRSAQGRTVVTWSGGQIGAEEFEEFALSAQVPKTPGKELAFPTLQTYANGETVRWIEAPSSEFPAPRVTLEGTEGQGNGFPVALAIVLATLLAVGMVGLFALRRVLLRSLEE